MRRVLARPSLVEEDLPVLAMEDLAEPAEETTRRAPPWTRIGLLALAAVAAGALVVIAREQMAQVSIARHQQCITDAQNRHTGDSFQGPLERALPACYRDPTFVLSNQQPIATQASSLSGSGRRGGTSRPSACRPAR